MTAAAIVDTGGGEAESFSVALVIHSDPATRAAIARLLAPLVALR